MKRFRQREMRLLAGTVCVALLAVFQLGVAKPFFKKARSLSSQVRIVTQDLARMRDVVGRRDSVEESYSAIRSRILSSRTPAREIINMLETVDGAARDAGVEVVSNVHEDRDSPSEHFDRYVVRFRGRAPYANLLGMIHALQRPELLLKIPRMEFSMRNHELEVELEVTRVVVHEVADAGKDGAS